MPFSTPPSCALCNRRSFEKMLRDMRPSLPLTVAALLVLTFAMCVEGRSGSMQWPRFMNCVRKRAGRDIGTPSGSCAARKMLGQFLTMRRVKCMHCDKYFHCTANWLATRRCRGRHNWKVASVISKCREYSQPGNPADSREDEEANRYGRAGGNCGARYLRPAKCAYNPKTGQCKW
ncbi:serum amyloid A protein-like [Dermacentor silvarum]|uniref:serum amyloid A protein-like n=1 Tax=Dermacentor silvarum TaxID=543639 RepID=UPI002100D826|nr:serum amyloid A protein-like [Dermacentor silvarum]